MYLDDFADNATVVIHFTTHAENGSLVAPSAAFVETDFRIYKNGSATEKTSINGITVASPFDSVVGKHVVTIDTSNDTGDAGFWAAGNDYRVEINSAKTVDGHLQTGVEIGSFSIENRHSGGGGGLDAAGFRAAIGLAAANLDTQLADLPTVAEFNARTLPSANYSLKTTQDTIFDIVEELEPPAIMTLLHAIPTNTEFNARTLPSADYFVVGDYTAPPTTAQIWGYFENLDDDVYSQLRDIRTNAEDANAKNTLILEDTGTTIPGLIAAIDTVVDAVKAKTDQFVFTGGGTVGPGAVAYPITVQVNGQPVDGAAVWVSTDEAGTNVIAGTLYTNSNGVTPDFMLDVGNYYAWAQKAKVNIQNPKAFEVVVP